MFMQFQLKYFDLTIFQFSLQNGDSDVVCNIHKETVNHPGIISRLYEIGITNPHPPPTLYVATAYQLPLQETSALQSARFKIGVSFDVGTGTGKGIVERLKKAKGATIKKATPFAFCQTSKSYIFSSNSFTLLLLAVSPSL